MCCRMLTLIHGCRILMMDKLFLLLLLVTVFAAGWLSHNAFEKRRSKSKQDDADIAHATDFLSLNLCAAGCFMASNDEDYADSFHASPLQDTDPKDFA